MENKRELPHYELLFIVSNKYTDEEQKSVAEKVKKLVEGASGQITYIEEWGKKKLAYPIKHQAYGYYHLMEFDAPALAMAGIDKTLRLEDGLLRHLIVTRPYRTPEEIMKEKEEYQKRRQKEPIETVSPKIETKKESELKSKAKVNLEELDKKLDKILDTDDLL